MLIFLRKENISILVLYLLAGLWPGIRFLCLVDSQTTAAASWAIQPARPTFNLQDLPGLRNAALRSGRTSSGLPFQILGTDDNFNSSSSSTPPKGATLLDTMPANLGLYINVTLASAGGREAVKTLLVDTGSGDLWFTRKRTSAETAVFDSYGSACCSSQMCCSAGKDRSCDPSDPRIKSAVSILSCSYNLEYGSHSCSGALGLTSTKIGSVSLPDIQVGSGNCDARVSSGSDGEDDAIPGILGLSFPALTRFTKPIVAEKLGAFTVQQAQEATYLFTGADALAVQPASGLKYQTVPLAPVAGLSKLFYWSSKLTSIGGYNTVFAVDGVFDTGTTLMLAPSLRNLKAAIGPLVTEGNDCKLLTCGSSSPVAMYHCKSLDKLKNLSFGFQSTSDPIALTLTPQQYAIKNLCWKGMYTILVGDSGSLGAAGLGDMWMLGMTFLKNFPLIQHDLSNQKLAFAVEDGTGIAGIKNGIAIDPRDEALFYNGAEEYTGGAQPQDDSSSLDPSPTSNNRKTSAGARLWGELDVSRATMGFCFAAGLLGLQGIMI